MATRVNNVGVGRYETRQPSRRRPWPADAHPVDAPADPVIVLGLDAATRRPASVRRLPGTPELLKALRARRPAAKASAG